MKRFIVAGVCASAAWGAGYGIYPEESTQLLNVAANALVRVWESVEANPFPMVIALGTFLLTVVYHKARGKSLRESVEVAATRVTVIPVPQLEKHETENAVVKRAKARATRSQLIADQIGVQNRQRKLPDEIIKAEKEACYTQQDLTDAQRSLTTRKQAHTEAVAKLEALRKENAARNEELAEIEAELKRLNDLI